MTGVGKIYEMYRDGVLESDDEVAVTFDADTMEALSVPLVNVRATIGSVVESGLLEHEIADSILDIARKLFYPDRNYRNIVSESMKKGIISDPDKGKLLDCLLEHEVDVKREDAVRVLEMIKGMI